MMNIIDVIKESWLFDEHFKGITTALTIAISAWSTRSIRRLFSPFFSIFKNDLSSNFLKLSTDDKLAALKLIGEYKETDGKYDILMKELKLKQYGLYYPLPILNSLFNYIYDENIRINSIGFLSFLDCNEIFNYERNSIPSYSLKKMIPLITVYAVIIFFLASCFFDIVNLINLLWYPPITAINVLSIISLVVIILIMIRFVYIIIKNFISFFWAIAFSKKFKKYVLLRSMEKLVDKYRM